MKPQPTIGVFDAGFSTTVLPAATGPSGHTDEDGQREVPRWDHHAGANRLEPRFVDLAGVIRHRDRFSHGEGLMRVVAAEVDGLSDIGLGLGPVLPRLECLPCSEVVDPLGDQITDSMHESRPLRGRTTGPVRERLPRGAESFCRMRARRR